MGAGTEVQSLREQALESEAEVAKAKLAVLKAKEAKRQEMDQIKSYSAKHGQDVTGVAENAHNEPALTCGQMRFFGMSLPPVCDKYLKTSTSKAGQSMANEPNRGKLATNEVEVERILRQYGEKFQMSATSKQTPSAAAVGAIAGQLAQKELTEAQTALACGQIKLDYTGTVKLPKFCEKYLEPAALKK
jgi:hypothetical protein